jgi:hypothetical protein
MGASGAYGGSGGRAWGKARAQAGEFGDNPSADNAKQLLANIADALDWDGDDGDQQDGDPDSGDGQQKTVLDQGAAFVVRPRPRRLGGADGPSGDGGGGPTGGAGTAVGGTGGGAGTRRSRTRVAQVGGSVAAAGLAYRGRDEGTLRQFGLSLAQLDGLDAHEQARLILDAVTGSVGGMQEDELQHASGVAVLALLDPDTTSDDAVRAFITDYVFDVSITEVGDELRDGTRDGYTTVDEEDQLSDIIETCVNQVDLPQQLAADNIQAAIYKALDDARAFLRAGE